MMKGFDQIKRLVRGDQTLWAIFLCQSFGSVILVGNMHFLHIYTLLQL